MGGGAARTWATVDGAPNASFKAGIRKRSLALRRASAINRAGDAPALQQLQEQAKGAMKAQYMVCHRSKPAALSSLTSTRRATITASVIDGLRFIFMSKYNGECVIPVCAKKTCGSNCRTPLLHSTAVQSAMKICNCKIAHTRFGCLSRDRKSQAPEDQVELAIEALFRKALIDADWVAVKLEEQDVVLSEAEKAAAINIAAQAAAASVMAGLDNKASPIAAMPTPAAPRPLVQAKLAFRQPDALHTAPHHAISDLVDDALKKLGSKAEPHDTHGPSVFGKGVTIGNHESGWWRQALSKHMSLWVENLAMPTMPAACGSVTSFSGSGIASLPDRPDPDAFYSIGLETTVIDWNAPRFKTILNAHGMSSTPCGLPSCPDAVSGQYNTKPMSTAAGVRNKNWSSHQSQPTGVLRSDGRMSPLVSAVGYCNTCEKPFKHSNQHVLRRLPHELAIQAPVEPAYGHRGQERWLLGRSITSTLEFDLTTGQGFAALHKKLLEAGREAHSELHRAYNSAVLAYHAALEAAVGDTRWNSLCDGDRLELVSRRAEWLHLQRLCEEGVGVSLYKPHSEAGGGAIYAPPGSGPSSIEEAFLAAAESRRHYRVGYQNMVGAARWVAIDLTKNTAKKFGGPNRKQKWLATMTNEEGRLVATTVVESSSFSAIKPWLEHIASRDTFNPDDNKLGVVIDNVPPAGDPTKSAFIRGHLEALGASFVVQDTYHVRQAASKHFNNTHPRFWEMVIMGIRNATSRLDPTLEQTLDLRLQGGFVHFKVPRFHRKVKYVLPRKKTVPVVSDSATEMTAAQRDDPNYPSGTALTKQEIAEYKRSGAYHEFFARESTVVPLVPVPEMAMKQQMAALTASIGAEFFDDAGDPIKCTETGKVLIASRVDLETVMNNCLKRAINTIIPDDTSTLGYSPVMQYNAETGCSEPKVCQSTGMKRYVMEYHSSGNESVHSRIVNIITGDNAGEILATALFYEGTPRLNRGVDEARGRPTIGHDKPWLAQQAIDMENTVEGLFAKRARPMYPGLPLPPTQAGLRGVGSTANQLELTPDQVASFTDVTVMPRALGGQGAANVGGFDASSRKRGGAVVHAAPPKLPALVRAVACGATHTSGDPNTVALHAKIAKVNTMVRAVADSSDTFIHNPDYGTVKLQQRLHLEQIIKVCQRGLVELDPSVNQLQPENDQLGPRDREQPAPSTEQPSPTPTSMMTAFSNAVTGAAGPVLNWMRSPGKGKAKLDPPTSCSRPPLSPNVGGSLAGTTNLPAETHGAAAAASSSFFSANWAPPSPAVGAPATSSAVRVGVAEVEQPPKKRAKTEKAPEWPCNCSEPGLPLYVVPLVDGGHYQYGLKAGRKIHRSSCTRTSNAGRVPQKGDKVTMSSLCGKKEGKVLVYTGSAGKGKWNKWAWIDGTWCYKSNATTPSKAQQKYCVPTA